MTTPPVGSVALDLPAVEIRNGRLNPSEILAGMNFRSVYLPVFRNAIAESMDVFDFADPNMVSGARDVTTVAPQALFMLNNEFVIKHAQVLAYRVVTQAAKTDGARIDLAYKLTLGRPATAVEKDRAGYYVAGYLRDPAATRGKTADKAKMDAWSSFCQALLGCAEFRYLN